MAGTTLDSCHPHWLARSFLVIAPQSRLDKEWMPELLGQDGKPRCVCTCPAFSPYCWQAAYSMTPESRPDRFPSSGLMTPAAFLPLVGARKPAAFTTGVNCVVWDRRGEVGLNDESASTENATVLKQLLQRIPVVEVLPTDQFDQSFFAAPYILADGGRVDRANLAEQMGKALGVWREDGRHNYVELIVRRVLASTLQTYTETEKLGGLLEELATRLFGMWEQLLGLSVRFSVTPDTVLADGRQRTSRPLRLCLQASRRWQNDLCRLSVIKCDWAASREGPEARQGKGHGGQKGADDVENPLNAAGRFFSALDRKLALETCESMLTGNWLDPDQLPIQQEGLRGKLLECRDSVLREEEHPQISPENVHGGKGDLRSPISHVFFGGQPGQHGQFGRASFTVSHKASLLCVGNNVVTPVGLLHLALVGHSDPLIPYDPPGVETQYVFKPASVEHAAETAEDLFKHAVQAYDSHRAFELLADALHVQVEAVDRYSGLHGNKTADYMSFLWSWFRKLQKEDPPGFSSIAAEHFDSIYTDLARVIGRLHDVGKSELDRDLLNAVGHLHPADRDKLDKHAEGGEELLRRLEPVPTYRELIELLRGGARLHHKFTSSRAANWNEEDDAFLSSVSSRVHEYLANREGTSPPEPKPLLMVLSLADTLHTTLHGRVYRPARVIDEVLVDLWGAVGSADYLPFWLYRYLCKVVLRIHEACGGEDWPDAALPEGSGPRAADWVPVAEALRLEHHQVTAEALEEVLRAEAPDGRPPQGILIARWSALRDKTSAEIDRRLRELLTAAEGDRSDDELNHWLSCCLTALPTDRNAGGQCASADCAFAVRAGYVLPQLRFYILSAATRHMIHHWHEEQGISPERIGRVVGQCCEHLLHQWGDLLEGSLKPEYEDAVLKLALSHSHERQINPEDHPPGEARENGNLQQSEQDHHQYRVAMNDVFLKYCNRVLLACDEELRGAVRAEYGYCGNESEGESSRQRI